MNSPGPRRWLIRAAGLLAVAVFLGLVARYWHPPYGFTSLLQLDASNDDTKIAAFRAQPVYVYHGTGGYDGLYYAQIAYHPALDAPELRPAIDNLSYRARRILLPACAWLLAGGNPAWIVHVYSVLNVAAWLALALLLWRLLGVDDGRGWLAWAGLMFSAGALGSVRFALTDLAALALIAGAFLAAERGRPHWAAVTAAAAGLTRETSLLALPGLWEKPWLTWRNVGRSLAVILPLLAWLGYIRWRVGPVEAGMGNFDWPVAAFARKWHADLIAARTNDLRWLAWTTLLATTGLTVQAAFFLTRWRPGDRWWRLGASYSVFMFFLGWAVWEGFPGATTRVLLPLNLAFNVFVHRTRAPLAWLLLGNLTVFSGLLTLDYLPNDPLEVSARIDGTSYTGQFGDGWSTREHNWRHTWSWCAGKGVLSLEAEPGPARLVRLEFGIRSLVTRTVVISQDGREIWRGLVGQERVAESVPVRLAGARATLEFSTDTPGVREGPGPGARMLAFAVYDPRLTPPDSPR